MLVKKIRKGFIYTTSNYYKKIIIIIISYYQILLLYKYRTKRHGFNHYIIGQLKEIAKALFNIKADARVDQDLSNDDCKLD